MSEKKRIASFRNLAWTLDTLQTFLKLAKMRKQFLPVIITICTFQFVCLKVAFPQTYPFVNYTVDDGLVNSNVKSILQDRKGYLWFGTTNGLSKFDGQDFTNYLPGDELVGNTIESIVEDNQGNIWFGTRRGVSKYNGKKWMNYTTEDGLANNNVREIFEDAKGNLWFATYGGGVSKYDGRKWITISTDDGLASNRVFAILEDTKGNLWFGTNQGVSKFDGKNWSTYTVKDGLAHRSVISILEDKSGKLWFSAYEEGVTSFDGSKWTKYTTDDGLADNYFRSIYEDTEGNLWFSTINGISKFDGYSWQSITEHNGLSHNQVNTIIEDREGNLWFGTRNGVDKLTGLAFATYTDKDGLCNNVVKTIFEDTEGNFWFGTSHGVSRFDGEKWNTYTAANGLAGNNISSILQDKEGRLWFATADGVARFDKGQWKKFTIENGLSNNLIISMLVDSEGNLWFGSWLGGVSKFDGKNWRTFTVQDGLANNNVNAILEDSEGKLWFGTYGGGVSSYDGENLKTYTITDGLADNYINAIYEDKEGNLIFGTDVGGISIFDGKRFVNYSTENGLSTNSIFFITEVDSCLYLGTNQGVNVFDGKKFYLFTSHDGLASNNMNKGACLKDSNGNLWFGTLKGVTKFNPKIFKYKLFPPLVNITHVSTLAQDIIPDGYHLDHNNNHVRFDYVGIYFTDPEALQYKYKLEGVDKDWQVTTLRSVQYTYMPNGNYRFKVKAGITKDIWSTNPAEFSFVIAPPFWNTWWFRIFSIVFVLGIIYGTFNEWHRRKAAKELKENNIAMKNTLAMLNQEMDERKNAEEALRESEKKYRTLFESAREGILISDHNGILFSANPAAAKLLGYNNTEELVGMPAKNLYVDIRQREELFNELMKKGYVEDREFMFRRKDGITIYILSSITVQKDKKGNIIQAPSIFYDITERKKTEKLLQKSHDELETKVVERTKELTQANIQLKELDQLKSMFIASMSHELRTPLNSIIGFTDIILDSMSGEINEEQRKQLTIVESSAKHLLALINDIIDVSKIEAEKVELYIEEFDLSEIVQDVKDSFTVAADKKGLKMPLNIPERLIIKSDERRVKQIIVNLVGNAVKFTDKGEIEIKAVKNDGIVEVSVRDTGIGMRKQDMDRLFNAFSQITIEGRTEEGTGLGLYLSKKIANLLGGGISAESEFGKGSEFTFTLPLEYADNKR